MLQCSVENVKKNEGFAKDCHLGNSYTPILSEPGFTGFPDL